tara:strand:- start:21082 stop:21849 length:768 start_codon:yes stop_codon:yes gene_type:complete
LKKQLELDKQQLIKILSFSAIACLVINIIALLFPKFWRNLLIGKEKLEFSLTFQDVMWFIFVIGIFLVIHRVKRLREIQKYKGHTYLPEDFETIIDSGYLTEVIKKTKKDAGEDLGILPYMILQICLQFRTNNSISLTTDFLTKQLELFFHEVELGFSKIKYIIWLIPSLGFMGTVYGIGLAVSRLSEGSLDDPELLTKMASNLGVAFNTTLLALILSVILQYFAQHYEAKEEDIINGFGKYILDNLINKLIEHK